MAVVETASRHRNRGSSRRDDMDRREFLKLLGSSVFLPFFGGSRRKRKWYTAPDMGTGTIVDPYTLTEALASGSIKPGDTVYLRGGVYRMADDILRFPGGNAEASITWKAYEGERPIITREDDKPPYVEFGRYAVADGLWVGGEKENVEARSVFALSDVTIKNCTFFGYYGAIVEGGHTRNKYLGNRFINNGQPVHYHAIYISKAHDNMGDCVIDGNTFVSNLGYSVQGWHFAKNMTVRNNFFGDSQWMIVLPNTDHICEQNVLWSATSTDGSKIPLNLSATARVSYRDNFFGPKPSNHLYGGQYRWYGDNVWRSGWVSENNHYMPGGWSFPDPGAINLEEGDELSLLGNSAARIEEAVAAIKASFTTQTVSEIQADETIETHFATLRAVIDTWKANTV